MKVDLSWSTRAIKAIPAFFRFWNDIDIYIEDQKTHTQLIYRELIKKIAADRFSVEKVFPLGNREAVIAACKSDQGTGGRARLYVIDGDLNLLTGAQAPRIRRLFQHSVYCVENYLISELAVIELLYEELAHKDKATIKSELAFSTWVNEVLCLTDLFKMFAVQRILTPSAISVGAGIGGLLAKSNPPSVDRNLVRDEVKRIYKDLCTEKGKSVVDATLLLVTEKLSGFKDQFAAISGKDYLMKALRWQIHKTAKIKGSRESVELRLARHCNIRTHKDFTKAVESAAKLKTSKPPS